MDAIKGCQASAEVALRMLIQKCLEAHLIGLKKGGAELTIGPKRVDYLLERGGILNL